MKSYLPFWCCYLHQGMITSLTLQGVVGYFRYAGLELTQLSWLSLCMLPWVAKFLWAPWAERHTLSLRGNVYLGSLVLLQLGMALVLAAVGLFLPDARLTPVITALLLLSVLSATHDVYADGLTISSTDAATRPYANTAQVGGSYLGILFGSFVFLMLAQHQGWTWAFLGLAGLSLLLLLPLLVPGFLRRSLYSRQNYPHAARLDLSGLRSLWPALALTALYYLAMRGMLALQTVILVDQGLSLSALGQTIFTYSTIASGIGVLLGGWLARHLGPLRCLLPVMAAHAALAMLLALGYSSFSLGTWLSLFGLVNVAAASGFVTLYNVLMGQVRAHQPASDYAVFQSIDAALAMLTTLAALQLASRTGYQFVLAMLALLAIACLWLVSLLLERLTLKLPLLTTEPVTANERGHG